MLRLANFEMKGAAYEVIMIEIFVIQVTPFAKVLRNSKEDVTVL